MFIVKICHSDTIYARIECEKSFVVQIWTNTQNQRNWKNQNENTNIGPQNLNKTFVAWSRSSSSSIVVAVVYVFYYFVFQNSKSSKMCVTNSEISAAARDLYMSQQTTKSENSYLKWFHFISFDPNRAYTHVCVPKHKWNPRN